LAFFVLMDLVQQRALVLLACCDGRFTAALIPDAERRLLAPLAAWSEGSFAAHRGALRDVGSAVPGAREEADEAKGAREIGELLFSPLASLLSRSALPWFLFPDGVLNEVPLEMLRTAEEARFGQGRAVHLCLRAAGTAASSRRVAFARGWLGLGGVPAAPNFPYLDGSLEEVDGLASRLRAQGHPAAALTGQDATAAALRAHLETHRPAVLHIAAHGSVVKEYPEACTLILADDRESPARELLPFRRIRELDLSGVDLVVLSACKSLLGRSGRSEGMEGLAWAFLQAGAAQVIASRYSVDDQETARWMAVLYRHLQGHPVAEALGRARDECLGELEMAPRHVAAWSVWS